VCELFSTGSVLLFRGDFVGTQVSRKTVVDFAPIPNVGYNRSIFEWGPNMSNAIIEAIRTSSPEQKREAWAVLQRELNEPEEKKKVPLPLSFEIGDDEEVALDKHGFPVLTPEFEAELARRAREPGETLTVEQFIAEVEAELKRQK